MVPNKSEEIRAKIIAHVKATVEFQRNSITHWHKGEDGGEPQREIDVGPETLKTEILSRDDSGKWYLEKQGQDKKEIIFHKDIVDFAVDYRLKTDCSREWSAATKRIWAAEIKETRHGLLQVNLAARWKAMDDYIKTNKEIMEHFEETKNAKMRKGGKKSEAAQSSGLAVAKSRSLSTFCEEVNERMAQVGSSDIVQALIERYNSAMKAQGDNTTYFQKLATVGSHVLTHGQTAKAGTLEKPADYLFFSSMADLNQYLQSKPEQLQVMLVRDTKWWKSIVNRPTKKSFFEELRYNPSDSLAVQDLGRNVQKAEDGGQNLAVVSMLVKNLLPLLHEPKNEPINLLDLASQARLTPYPIKENCYLLEECIDNNRRRLTRDGKVRNVPSGKNKFGWKHHNIDIEGCPSFAVFGQAGAISGAHADAYGAMSWLTLEANDGEVQAKKAWAIVNLKNLSVDYEKQNLKAFRDSSYQWLPPTDCIKILYLEEGDTLVMPPGTIHIPIAITDCLMSGGAVWGLWCVKDTLRSYLATTQSENLTNEGSAVQTIGILDELETILLKRCKIMGLEDAIVQEYRDLIRKIKNEGEESEKRVKIEMKNEGEGSRKRVKIEIKNEGEGCEKRVKTERT